MKTFLTTIVLIVASALNVSASDTGEMMTIILNSASEIKEGLRLDVYAGPCLSSFYYIKDRDNNKESSLRPGFTLGAGLDIPFKRSLQYASFHPSLNFTLKRMKDTLTDELSATHGNKYNLGFIEMPLDFRYNVGDVGRFYAGGGPMLSFGVCGNSFDSIHRFGVGLHLSLGIIFKRVIVDVGGSTMLTKSTDMRVENERVRINNYQLNVGYCF